jgi:hypothetical protein
MNVECLRAIREFIGVPLKLITLSISDDLVTTPLRMFRSVVFPEPLGPRIAVREFGGKTAEIPFRMRVSPTACTRFSHSICTPVGPGRQLCVRMSQGGCCEDSQRWHAAMKIYVGMEVVVVCELLEKKVLRLS